MRVIALVEYGVVGDNEYRYVERFETEYFDIPEHIKYFWRRRFIKMLGERGIVCNYINEIKVEYEK